MPTLVLKAKMLSLSGDFTVLDATGAEVLFVDSKALRWLTEMQLWSPDRRTHRGTVRGVMSFAPKMNLELPDGTVVAQITGKALSWRPRLTVAWSDGRTWDVTGNFLEKDYAVTEAGHPVAQVRQKWLSMTDTYSLDVPDGQDPLWFVGVALAIEALAEQKKSSSSMSVT